MFLLHTLKNEILSLHVQLAFGCKEITLLKQLALEYEWFEKVSISLDHENDLCHASKGRQSHFEISLSTLMPLFPESAHSVAMVKHAMDIAKKTTNFLNPSQVPVVTVDQVLFALAKQIQWHWPTHYGEIKMFIKFGGLHVEIAAFRMLGDLLKDSGWTGALTEAEIATAGTAESFLSVSHVTKTRQAHQVTGSSLYLLSKEVHCKYRQARETAKEPALTFDD